MIIGAAHYQTAQRVPETRQRMANSEQQQGSIQLAEDKVTLTSRGDDFSATYARPTPTRKAAEPSLTQIARDNLLAQRIGLSREKLDELEQKKQEIEGSTELSVEEKQRLLADLDKQKEALIKQANERRQSRDDEERQSNPGAESSS